MTPKMLSVLNLPSTSANSEMNVSKYFKDLFIFILLLNFNFLEQKTHLQKFLLKYHLQAIKAIS